MPRNVGPHKAPTQAGALPATAWAVYHHSMTTPTTLTIRTFADRAEAMAHAVLRAGEAPRFVAFDDTIGCPMEQLLGALEWTRVVGIIPDDDLLHAGRLTSDTAAAVIERKTAEGRRYIFLGPRLDTPQALPADGEVLLDEPGVLAIGFAERANALAHFLRITQGAGAIFAQLGRRAPELRHLRRWLPPIVQELDASRRMSAGWFAASAGGVLFLGDEGTDAAWRYIEVGIDS